MTPHPNASGYLRVSTAHQATERNVSLDVQRERIAAISQERGLVLAAEYVDVYSGRKDNRQQYQRLLASLRARETTVVVVQFLDRFGRNPREILRRIWEIEELGGSVIAADEDISHELIRMIKAWQAGQESEKIAARVLPTMERVVREGRWPGRPPFGFDLVKDPDSPQRGHLVPNEDAALVRRIFSLYATDAYGHASLAALLNREGIPSPMGGIWWSGHVANILRTTAYHGQLAWRGQAIPGGCPAIVDDELWRRAQDATARRRKSWSRRPPAERRMLAGLVYCGCGTVRHSHHYHDPRGTSRGVTELYCCSRHNRAGVCPIGSVHAEKLEAWVLEQVRAWRIPTVSLKDDDEPLRISTLEADHARERARLQSRLRQIEQRRQRSYDELMDRAITRDEYRANDLRYLADIAQIEQELAAIPEPVERRVRPAPDDLRNLLARLGTANAADLRAVLALLIERVEVVSKTEWRIVPRAEVAELIGFPSSY